MQHWHLSYRSDPIALPLANAHYNRQSPDSPQFVPPGRCLVLITRNRKALWVTSYPIAEYTHHAWAGAWVNSLFRNDQSGYLPSTLIREAVATTRWWSEHIWKCPVPDQGMITFVDATKVRAKARWDTKREWGRCYLKAGFMQVGYTKQDHLVALQLLPGDMPAPMAPLPRLPKGPQLPLFSSFYEQLEEESMV